MRITSLILFVVYLNIADAQHIGGAGYATLGGGYAATEGLGKLLGYQPAISPVGILAGGGGFAYFNNFIIGGQGNGFVGASFDNGLSTYQIAHGWGGLEAGYQVWGKRGKFLFLSGIIGGRGTTLNITKGSDRGKSLAQGSPMLGVQGHLMQFLIGKNDSPDEMGGFMIGIRAGAWLGIENASWEHDTNIPLIAVPYQPYGFFVGLSFGGGGFGKFGK